MRTMRVMLLVAVGFCAGADSPNGSKELVPDPEWRAVPGEQVEVNEENSPACVSYAAYWSYVKSEAAKDRVGVERLLDAKQVAPLPKGTKVHILKSYRPAERPEPIASGMTTDQMMRHRQSSILDQEEDKAVYPVEVRVMAGDMKGMVRFVPEDRLAKLIPKPEPVFFRIYSANGNVEGARFVRPRLALPKAARGKPVDPNVRAANMLRAAQKLERSGDLVGAIGAYWFVTQDFPDSPSAKTASRRLAAIGLRKQPDGSYAIRLKGTK